MVSELIRFAGPDWLIGGCICFALARYCGRVGWVVASLLGGLAALVVLWGGATVERLQFLFLSLTAILLLAVLKARVWQFALAGCVASALPVALVGLYGQREFAAAAERVPFESLANRLAYEGQTGSPRVTSFAAALSPEQLDELDERTGELDYGWEYGTRRIRSLRLVHASRLEQFLNAEGFFGVSRMLRPSPAIAERKWSPPPIPFPRADALLGGSPNAAYQPVATVPPLLPAHAWFEPYHCSALADFASSDSCGFILDRDHVVGFRRHSLSLVPEGPNKPTRQENPYWYTLRVELVSLLKHEEPGVYVSEYLPNMDQLQGAPIRPLDEFERRSIAALGPESDIIVAGVGPYVRMLGAIRASKQCLVCHEVEHGHLLGAFSYELLSEAPRAYELLPQPKPTDEVRN